jgi:undecaprenyl-phosphate 4-deoxy-4-formamido-L-arabinose transferase
MVPYQNVSIVIPVFNANTTLISLVDRMNGALFKQCERFELIFVDDGSSDNSWDIITHLCEQHEWVSGVKLAHNMGQQAATLVGLRYARYPISVTMDDDLQHPPEAIPKLLAALKPDIDIVYGAPQALPLTLYRTLVSLSKQAVSIITGVPSLRYMRSFRALRTAVYPWSNLAITEWSAVDGLLKHANPKVEVVRVSYMPRMTGHSSYNIWRSVRLMYMLWKSTYEKPQPAIQDPVPISKKAGWLTA